MKMLRESGVELALITGRTSRASNCARKISASNCCTRAWTTSAAPTPNCSRHAASTAAATGYMGDDLVDLPVLHPLRFCATVPARRSAVKQHADYVTRAARRPRRRARSLRIDHARAGHARAPACRPICNDAASITAWFPVAAARGAGGADRLAGSPGAAAGTHERRQSAARSGLHRRELLGDPHRTRTARRATR